VASTARGFFFAHKRKFVPVGIRTRDLMGRPYLSSSRQLDSRSFGYADLREHQDPMQSQACPSEDLESSHKPHVYEIHLLLLTKNVCRTVGIVGTPVVITKLKKPPAGSPNGHVSAPNRLSSHELAYINLQLA